MTNLCAAYGQGQNSSFAGAISHHCRRPSQPRNTGSVDNGKFIAIWKQEDGKWKLFREIWNTNNAPPVPVQAK